MIAGARGGLRMSPRAAQPGHIGSDAEASSPGGQSGSRREPSRPRGRPPADCERSVPTLGPAPCPGSRPPQPTAGTQPRPAKGNERAAERKPRERWHEDTDPRDELRHHGHATPGTPSATHSVKAVPEIGLHHPGAYLLVSAVCCWEIHSPSSALAPRLACRPRDKVPPFLETRDPSRWTRQDPAWTATHL